MKRIVVIFALIAGTGTGVATGPAQADIVLPNGGVIECYCTDATGGRVELGQSICLYVDGRAFMARCEMSLNVPMWRQTDESCTTSFLDRLHAVEPAADPGGIDPKV